MPRRTITPVWFLGFLSLLLVFVAFLDWAETTQKLDRLLHDSWVRLNQRQPPRDIVIIAIDPDSLATVGRWPWSRDTQTQLFRQLRKAKLQAVVIDMLFVEPSRTPQVDLALGAAIGELPNAVLPVLTESRLSKGEKLPIPAITSAADDFGHINLPIDDDGIVRRVHLKAGFRQAHWPILALAAWQHLDGGLKGGLEGDAALPGRRLTGNRGSNEWVFDHEVLIPFYGPSGSFRSVSAASVLDGSADFHALSGAIALVGITALGLTDSVPTPVSALDRLVPGVEIHANVMAGLREGTLVTRIDKRLALVAALVILPLLLFTYLRSRPSVALLAAVAGSLLPVIGSFLLYRMAGLWFAPLSVSVSALVSYVLWSWHRLDFVRRFLERESRALEPHLPRSDDSGDAALIAFFDHASTHLPITGWSLRMESRLLHGEEVLTVSGSGEVMPVAGWTRFDDVYRKRYGDADRLQIRVRISLAERAPDILAYIDSLARVRSRAMPKRPLGSIERLQNTALALSEQTAWLRSVKVFSETVMANSPAGFAVWNPAGEMLRCNSLLLDMVPDLSSRPLLHEFILAIGAASESSPSGSSAMRALILDGAGWQTTRSDGEVEQIINFTASGEHLSDRLITVVVLDVSALRSVEQARAEMVDYLSHDLRSPLISALYLLDDDGGANLPTEERDRQLERHIGHSLAMMDELLHVARADSLAAEEFSDVPFNAVVDNAADHLSPQARATQVAIDVDQPEETLWLKGDAASLERAVVNVLGNALKYSPAGSRVQVRVTVQADDGDVFDGESGTLELSVSDAGPGIDPAIKDTLFQRFRRDQRTAGRYQGMGLGLALVARVVQQHKGIVYADNLDPGTRVTMRLPLLTVSGVNE